MPLPRMPLEPMLNDQTMPAIGHVEVTPADADLATVLRQIRCAVGGTVRVTGLDGGVCNYTAVAAGDTLMGYFTRIHATGTTCTGITGLI